MLGDGRAGLRAVRTAAITLAFPGYSSGTAGKDAAQLAEFEASRSAAATQPLEVLDVERLIRRGRQPRIRPQASADRSPGAEAPPLAQGRSGGQRWYMRYSVIIGFIVLECLALVVELSGFRLPPVLGQVMPVIIAMHLPAVLGLVIATAIVGVIAACALYRIRTHGPAHHP